MRQHRCLVGGGVHSRRTGATGAAALAALAALTLRSASAQTSLGTLNGIVYTSCVMPAGSTTVYMGGAFTVPHSRIARYNGTAGSWSALGSGGVGINNAVYSMLNWDDAVMYVGGVFTTAGGVSASRIARYIVANNTFQPMGSGASGGVLALARNGSTLFAGGAFVTIGGVAANYVAQYDTVTGVWAALASGVTSSGVNSLYMWRGVLYVVRDPRS
jgi:trimeric autotransporter adhesin